jgi:hypothetical protein
MKKSRNIQTRKVSSQMESNDIDLFDNRNACKKFWTRYMIAELKLAVGIKRLAHL